MGKPVEYPPLKIIIESAPGGRLRVVAEGEPSDLALNLAVAMQEVPELKEAVFAAVREVNAPDN